MHLIIREREREREIEHNCVLCPPGFLILVEFYSRVYYYIIIIEFIIELQ